MLGPFKVSRKSTVLAALGDAGVGPGDCVLDLGSGDGRFCVAAVRVLGARSAVGIELDARLVAMARQLAEKCGVGGAVTFLCRDLMTLEEREARALLSSQQATSLPTPLLPSLEDAPATAATTSCCPQDAGADTAVATASSDRSSRTPSCSSLRHAAVVVFLLPESEERFRELLLPLYASGARIIAIYWPLTGLQLRSQGNNFYVYQSLELC